MKKRHNTAGFAAAALLVAGVGLTACGDNERSAEAETPTAEAEVTTTLPESQVSDQQLQAAAEGAAAIAETPQAGSSVVVSPEPTGPATGSGAQPSGSASTPH